MVTQTGNSRMDQQDEASLAEPCPGLCPCWSGMLSDALVTGAFPTLRAGNVSPSQGEASVSGKLWGSGRAEEGGWSPVLSVANCRVSGTGKRPEGGLGQGGDTTKLVGWGSQAQEPLTARSAEAPVLHQLRSPASGAGPLLLSCHQGPTSRCPLTTRTKPAPTNNKSNCAGQEPEPEQGTPR